MEDLSGRYLTSEWSPDPVLDLYLMFSDAYGRDKPPRNPAHSTAKTSETNNPSTTPSPVPYARNSSGKRSVYHVATRRFAKSALRPTWWTTPLNALLARAKLRVWTSCVRMKDSETE